MIFNFTRNTAGQAEGGDFRKLTTTMVLLETGVYKTSMGRGRGNSTSILAVEIKVSSQV